MRVVLPAPFAPSRPTTSPRPTVRSDRGHGGERAEAPLLPCWPGRGCPSATFPFRWRARRRRRRPRNRAALAARRRAACPPGPIPASWCRAARTGRRDARRPSRVPTAPGTWRRMSSGVPLASTCPAVKQHHGGRAGRLVHVGRGDRDGRAFHRGPGDEPPQVSAADRVDARGRLVEDQQLRGVQQGQPHGQLALHPAGQVPAEPVPRAAEPGLLEQLAGFPAALAAGQPVGAGSEAEVLRDGQVRVQPRGGRHVPDALLRGTAHGSRTGLEEPDEHPEAGGLPGPVPADHHRDPGRVDGYRDAGEGDLPAAADVDVFQPPAHAAARSPASSGACAFRLPGARSRRNLMIARPSTTTASRASSPSGCHRAETGVAFSITPLLTWMK